MTTLSPKEALEKLIAGHNIFLQDTVKTLTVDLNQQEISNLKKGQNPYAIIITCSDSRICPNLIFNAKLSELFVVRTAGNTLDSLGLGSVEFGVEHLNIPLIVVLGHEKCGAVKATIESVNAGKYPDNFEACIINSIEPAFRQVLCYNSCMSNTCCCNCTNTSLEDQCITANVKLTMSNLFKSKIIRNEIKNNNLKLVGGVYDFNGHINFFS